MRRVIFKALMLLAVIQTACAQSTPANHLVLHGTVKDKHGNTLQHVYILLKGSPWGTTTNNDGNYRIDITEYVNNTPNPVVEFQYQGYEYVQYTPDKSWQGEVRYDLQFTKRKRHKKHSHKHKH